MWDGRKHPIRGLWHRNGKDFARLTMEEDDGRKKLQWANLKAATAAEAQAEPDPLWTSGDIKEKFIALDLPPLENPDDYETLSAVTRAVRLGSEYRDWFVTGENWLRDRAALSGTTDTLRILFPPPGTTLYLDADLPKQGRRMYLRVTGPDHLDWKSDSLSLEREGSREIALLAAGHHQITVRDPASGAEARTWIDVRVR